MKISSLVIAADAAAVIYVEKVLMTPQVIHGHLVHTPLGQLIGVGLIFASPALGILFAMWLRGRSAAKSAAAVVARPRYGSLGGRL